MAYEPRVEELLANIRVAIDSDIDELDRVLPTSTASSAAGSLLRGSIREMHVSYNQPKKDADASISALRERVSRQKIENKVSVLQTVPPPKPAVRANPKPDGIGGILAGEMSKPPRIQPPLLRASYIDDEPEIAPIVVPEPYYAPPLEQAWSDEAPAPYYEPQQTYHPPQQALMSPQAAYEAQASFQNLTDTVLARALSETDISGMARDMLRPMLKNWLDDNLPQLVEQLVREEIERVARRGR